jgi:hypothetical protein
MNTLSICLRRLSLGLTLIILSAATGATDEALLEALLSNGVITKEQYEALKKGEEVKAITKKPAPTQDQSLLDVLLENGLISQAQYAALQVKGAQEKKTDPEAKASLKEGFKAKSQTVISRSSQASMCSSIPLGMTMKRPILPTARSSEERGLRSPARSSRIGISSSKRISLGQRGAARLTK